MIGDVIEGEFNNDKIEVGRLTKGNLEDLPKYLLCFSNNY
jgi:hypothetical protein